MPEWAPREDGNKSESLDVVNPSSPKSGPAARTICQPGGQHATLATTYSQTNSGQRYEQVGQSWHRRPVTRGYHRQNWRQLSTQFCQWSEKVYCTVEITERYGISRDPRLVTSQRAIYSNSASISQPTSSGITACSHCAQSPDGTVSER